MDPKSPLIEKVVSPNDSVTNNRAFELYEGYSKVSDIISRTHAAMGKVRQVKLTTASATSDKILTHVSPPTH
jgi:hypothetical protein